MKKRLVLTLMLIGLLAFGAGLGTYAWFTSTATSTDNVFETGTLNLDVNNNNGEPFALNLGTINNMQPGDLTDEVSVNIKNDGSLDLVWFGKIILLGDTKLAEALYVEDMKMEFLDKDGYSDIWEPTDHFIHEGKGYGTYANYYDTLIDNNMGVITLEKFLNDNAMGAGNGVQMGALKPDFAYRLTFKLGLAKKAGNEYQGDQVNALSLKYIVNATQVNAEAITALDENNDNISIASVSSLYNWFNLQLDKQ